MKRNLAKIYIIGIMAILLTPLAAMTFHATTEPIGNETEVPLPSIATEEGTWNLNYFPELGDWFESHFAFRPELISLNSTLREWVFGTSTSDSIIAGTDGWLYYAATLDDYQHNNNVSRRTLYNEAHNVALYQEVVESTGASFLFTIAPNKNTLYGSNMPQNDKVYNARYSDYERLVPYLEAEGVNYVELRDLFEENADPDNGEEPLYYKRDSHWNETGAVLVYNALLDAAGVQHETYADVTPEAVQDYYGDLANMLYPDSRFIAPETRLVYLADPSWEYTSDTTSVEENYITTHSKSGTGTLLMYRDSFGNSLLPYMAEAFKDAVFSKNEPLDGADLTTNHPDLVIYEKVERHLPTLASVPAMIAGPVRYPDLAAVNMAIPVDETSTTTCAQTETNGFITISGIAAGDSVGETTRFYVAVADDQGTPVYEAYTVNASSADGSSDYGYLLYLDAALVHGEIRDIQVIAVNGDDLTALYSMAEPAEEDAADDANDADTDAADADAAENADDEAAAADATDGADAADADSSAAGSSDTTGSAAAGTSTSSAATNNAGSAAQTTTPAATNPTPSAASAEAPATNASSADSSAGTAASGNDAASAATTPAADATVTTDTSTTDAGTAASAAGSTDTNSAAEAPAASTPATDTTAPAAEQPAATTTPAASATPYEVSRVFVEDCGYDSGYWDITYSDGSHQYIDVP